MTVNWHDEVFFGLHHDLHANATDTALGAGLTHEHLRERLLRIKPDWVQCDCKGHPGYTSWPTQVGSMSPGVVHDTLRIYRDVTRELGIRLGVHYSGVWDSRAIELHPEWAVVDAAGRPDPDVTCPLGGYTVGLMIPQLIEIIDRYDVDGFWIDGENWASKPCWCERCRAEFTRRTGILKVPDDENAPHWHDWLAFHRDLFVEHVTQYAEAVHRRKPGCLVCSNWMYTIRQPDAVRAPVDYFSGDYDWNWGANRAALEGRLLDGRAHGANGKSWDLMAWGFTKAGEMRGKLPWGMKPALHLCQEVAEVVALGGAVMIYNTPQRTGWLTGWQHEIIAQVGEFCRARRTVCFGSKTVPQAAILHLADHFYRHNSPLFNYGTAVRGVEGALHALLETHRSTDILTAEGALERMNTYPLVVVPEQTYLSIDIQKMLEKYAHDGGSVLISGAHLARECAGLVGVSPDGEPIDSVTYLQVEECAVGLLGPWQPVTPYDGTEVWDCRLEEQEPNKDRTAQPIVTRRAVGKGQIVAVHGPLFETYFLGHSPLLRRYIAELVSRMAIPWLVNMQASPRLEMVLRHKADRLMINLINRGAAETLSSNRVMVEELTPVGLLTLQVRATIPPEAVSLIPSGLPVDWQWANGWLTIQIPQIEIHEVVVIDWAASDDTNPGDH